jgi:hypothetical protein
MKSSFIAKLGIIHIPRTVYCNYPSKYFCILYYLMVTHSGRNVS